MPFFSLALAAMPSLKSALIHAFMRYATAFNSYSQRSACLILLAVSSYLNPGVIPHLPSTPRYIEFNTSYRLDIADTKNMPPSEAKVRTYLTLGLASSCYPAGSLFLGLITCLALRAGLGS